MGKKSIYLLVIIIILAFFALDIFTLKPNHNKDLSIDISPVPEKKIELTTLYFPDQGKQYLVKENRVIEYTVEPKEKVVLEHLIKGPFSKESNIVIPPNVKIYSIDTIGGTTYVNLSNEFRSNLQFGRNNEILAIYSIVNSLTELSNIKNVKILVEGQDTDVLQKYMPLDYKYKQNLNIINNPIKTPVEVVKAYLDLIENGEYRNAFDMLYTPAMVNLDYSMFYHYQKQRNIKEHLIYSYEMIEEESTATVNVDYSEVFWSGEVLNHKNKKFKLKNYYGEWKITIENISQFHKNNKSL